MSRHGLPVRVPCGVCLQFIDGWHDLPDEQQVAVPCGHTPDQILQVGETLLPTPVGPLEPDVLVCHPTAWRPVRLAVEATGKAPLFRIATSTHVEPDTVWLIPAPHVQGAAPEGDLHNPDLDTLTRWGTRFAHVLPGVTA